MAYNMTDYSKEVYNIISKVGTLTNEQIKLIDRGSSPESTIKFLQRYHYTKLIGNVYSVPYFKKHENLDAVACMWALLTLISNKEGSIDHEKLSTLIDGNSVINFSYIHDDSKVINFAYFDDAFFSKLAAIKQRFYDFTNVKPGEEKSAGIIHIFCITKPEILAQLQDMDITIPHKIAYIEGDLGGVPTVKFI